MRVPEFAAAMGYGVDLVCKVESGKRIPQRDYLVKADEVLNAGGLVAAAWEDVKKVRYPKTVRDIAKSEARAVELTAYGTHNLHGLLQTADTCTPCSRCGGRRTHRTRWNGWWLREWPAR
ncbi:hypothetical protein SHIRM173S_08608 [Streptomyces hirsutus]